MNFITTTAGELKEGDRFTHEYMREPATVIAKPRKWGASYRSRTVAAGTKMVNVKTDRFDKITMAANMPVRVYG